MVQYFYNPKGQSLIIYDEDKREIAVVERIMSVRVFIGGEVGIGDFGSETRGISRRARLNDTPEEESLGLVGKARKARAIQNVHKRQRICKNCGEPGHLAKTCPNATVLNRKAAESAEEI